MFIVSVCLSVLLSVIAFIMFFKDSYKMIKEPSFETFKDICFSTTIFLMCSLHVSISLLLQEVM